MKSWSLGSFRWAPPASRGLLTSTSRGARLFLRCAFTCVAVLLLAAVVLQAAEQDLILKDGTDQRVTEYHIIGDRVRYFSAERAEWEEIPVSLVDWKATKKAKLAAEKPPEPNLQPLEPIKQPPRFTVAPGVTLPASDGVYVYDGRNLLGLLQSQAAVRNDNARRILARLTPLPIVKGRAYAELPGKAAKVVVTGPSPVFYLQITAPSPQGYGLVRLSPKNDSRVVGDISIAPISGHQSESQQTVPVTSDQLRPGSADQPALLRLTPKRPLKSGQYAIVEYLDQHKMNLYVWDFGYHPEGAGKKSRQASRF